VTDRIGLRELLVVVAVAATGLVLAALVALGPWHSSTAPRTPIVTVVVPGGVAGTG
jgi:hypothetical protein